MENAGLVWECHVQWVTLYYIQVLVTAANATPNPALLVILCARTRLSVNVAI